MPCVLCRLYGRQPLTADYPSQTCLECRRRLTDDLTTIGGYTGLSAEPTLVRAPGPGRPGGTVHTIPARLDVLGLTAGGNPSVHDLDGDQDGELPVHVVLDEWVADWIALRHQGERRPVATVPVLAGWLRERLGWAVVDHPALAEVAREVRRLVARVKAAAGNAPTEKVIGACPTPMNGRACGQPLTADTWRDWITCERCGARWSRETWARLAHDLSAPS